MKRILLFVCAAAVGLGGLSGSAMACSNGYKKVKIDGNYVCALDVNASTKLKARTK